MPTTLSIILNFRQGLLVHACGIGAVLDHLNTQSAWQLNGVMSGCCIMARVPDTTLSIEPAG